MPSHSHETNSCQYWQNTRKMEQLDAVGKLLEVLSNAVEEDCEMAVIACKALCNFAINTSARAISHEQCLGLHAVLQPIVDTADEGGVGEEWASLVDVARELLDKLPFDESDDDMLEPLAQLADAGV